jgi:FMN-dependent NADH-azoreductase
MPQLEINLTALEKLIDQLSERDKIVLVRKLEAKTLPVRWTTFLRQIDNRRKKYPLKEKEIEGIVEKVRQEIYERSRR